jgi:DNA-binding NarL/FixJ family response regulator
VRRGQAVFGPQVAGRLLDSITGVNRAPLPELSEREREVLQLLVAGNGTHEIARRLYLSPKTVRNHVSHLLTKLNAPDRAQAIARARAAGFPDQP